MKSVKQECESCGGSGLYSGFMEKPGEAVICLSCGGKGWYEHRYREFTGRKKKRGIKSIKISAGRFIATGVGGVGKTMTYKEFEKNY